MKLMPSTRFGIAFTTTIFLLAGLLPVAALTWFSLRRSDESEARELSERVTHLQEEAARRERGWTQRLTALVRRESARSFTEFQYWHAPAALESESEGVLLSPLSAPSDPLVRDYLQVRIEQDAQQQLRALVESPRIPQNEWESEYRSASQYTNAMNRVPVLESALAQVDESWRTLAPLLPKLIEEASSDFRGAFETTSTDWKPEQEVLQAKANAIEIRSADQPMLRQEMSYRTLRTNDHAQRVASRARNMRNNNVESGGVESESKDALESGARERDPTSELEARRLAAEERSRAEERSQSEETRQVEVFAYRFWIDQQDPFKRSYMWRSVIVPPAISGGLPSVRLQFIWLNLSHLEGDWIQTQLASLTSTDRSGLSLSKIELQPHQADLTSPEGKPLIAGGMPLPRFELLPVTQDITLKFEAERKQSIVLASGYTLLLISLGSLLALTVLRRAELADQQSAFVSAVSHEMRTPLAAIRLHAEMLGQPALAASPERVSRNAAHIVREQERLLNTVSMVLESSRIERGSHRPAFESFELRPIVERACELATLRVDARDAELEIDWPEGLGDGPTVRADASATEFLLANLVDNALKHGVSSEGKARVRVSLVESEKSWMLRVDDSGPGVPSSERARVMQRFYRTHDGREKPGAGLGLWLCKRYAESQRWKLSLLESDQGGLRVEVLIPREVSADA